MTRTLLADLAALVATETCHATTDDERNHLQSIRDDIQRRLVPPRHVHDRYCGLLGCAYPDHDEPDITRERVMARPITTRYGGMR
jgi:hypothetical protein